MKKFREKNSEFVDSKLDVQSDGSDIEQRKSVFKESAGLALEYFPAKIVPGYELDATITCK